MSDSNQADTVTVTPIPNRRDDPPVPPSPPSPPHPDSATQHSPHSDDDPQDLHPFYVSKDVFDQIAKPKETPSKLPSMIEGHFADAFTFGRHRLFGSSIIFCFVRLQPYLYSHLPLLEKGMIPNLDTVYGGWDGIRIPYRNSHSSFHSVTDSRLSSLMDGSAIGVETSLHPVRLLQQNGCSYCFGGRKCHRGRDSSLPSATAEERRLLTVLVDGSATEVETVLYLVHC